MYSKCYWGFVQLKIYTLCFVMIMNYFRTLLLLALILLSSCNDSTNPEVTQSPTAIDYLFAGNAGTQTEYTISYVDTDSNGIKLTFVDTVTWTVMDRNVSRANGGNCVKMHQYVRGQNTRKGFETDYYFGLNNNSLCLFTSLTDTVGLIIIKNPITIGTQWIIKGSPSYESDMEHIIQGVDVPIVTTYKTLNTVRIDSKDTLFRRDSLMRLTETIAVYSKEYYAQGMLIVHSERTSTYVNEKKESTSIIDLIRYTKK